MKGEVKGMKTLIMKESPSAYYVHCFAHQLQLVLVAVAKGDVGASTIFANVSRLLNIVGVSCKRHDML
jgi:Mrp family chromosome partitioning ATPase